MAPISEVTPNAGNPFYQRIIALDKSDEKFSLQITAAFDILEIKASEIPTLYEADDAVNQDHNGLGPREEWFVRWLLKRFDVPEIQSDSPCVEPRAWLLLRLLIARLPKTVAARTLSTHKYTAILEKLLNWMQEKLQIQSLSNDRPSLVSQVSNASSSSATVQISSATTGENPRKRKRDIAEGGVLNTPEPTLVDYKKLYICICSVSQQILSRTACSSEGVEGFAAEHMKAAVKCSPDRAAKILGSSLINVRHILESLEPNDRFGANLHASTILSMIALWDLRSATNDDLAGRSSHKAFSAECLVPALQLILTCDTLSQGDDNTVVQELEKLVAIHVILPARSALLRERRTKEQNPGQATTAIEEIVKPLTHAASLDLEGISKNQTSSGLLTIPFLFDIALRCFPLKTFKQRLAEAPWLQSLLFQLTQCATVSPLTATSSSSMHASRDVLKSMLRLAIRSKIKIDVSMLDLFLLEISGLADETPETFIDWTLVSLCLQVDETLALPLRAEATSSNRHSSQPSGKVVTQLLARITTKGFRETSKNDGSLVLSSGLETYNLILDQVLLPFFGAFVHVRDLNGFIEIWQYQLVAWRSSGSLSVSTGLASNFAESVWENDKLLESVSTKLEASLTIGQISKVIRDFFDAMQVSSSPHTEDRASYYANTTIMNCLLDGIKSEVAISELTELASQICQHVSAVLCGAEKMQQRCNKKLWRILITVITRWPNLLQNFETAGIGHGVIIIEAQQLVEQALLSDSPPHDDVTNYGQALYAFRLILALIPARGEVDISNIRDQKVPAIINAVIKSMKRNEVNGNALTQEDHGVWLNWEGNLWIDSIDTPNGLLLGCAAQIILASKCLSCLDEALIYQFFTQLYWCTCLQKRDGLSGEQSSASLNYLWLWQELLHRSMLGSETSLLKCLCKVQVMNLDVADIQPLPLSIDHHHAFSVDSLLRMPIGGFDRQERAKIANVILSRIVSTGASMRVSALRNHVNLLIKCLELPNNSMDLVSTPSCLWGLAKVLDNVSGETEHTEVISLLRAFRQLACVTLDSIVLGSIQSNDKQVSIELLQSISDHIQPSSRVDSCLASLIVISNSIQSLWAHYESLKDVIRPRTPSLAHLRQKDFQWLVDSFIVFRTSQIAMWQVGILLQTLISYTDLLQSSLWGAEVRTSLQLGIEDVIVNFESQRRIAIMSDGPILHYLEDFLVVAKSIASLLSMSHPNVKAATMVDGVMNLHSKRAKRDLLRRFEDSFLVLGTTVQVEFMSQLVQREREAVSGDEDLLQMQRILFCQNEPSRKSEAMNAVLTQCFSALCDQLGRPTTLRLCILRMHCIDIILRKKPWIILQWHVDNVLSAITVMTSSSGPKFACEVAGNIFIGLCRLFASLLAVHRSKLGGRYHLMVLALQGLLHCLFEPYAKIVGNSPALVQPPWLDAHVTKLNESHAAAYTRLLTVICDPTVSAVTRSKNGIRQELNDETKRARNIAGQHLQYLIMDFCQCQLQGRMSPEMRPALNPGLYAVFDAMSQDTMRTINSALDSSGRSIFKVVYDDYRRFGRWQGA